MFESRSDIHEAFASYELASFAASVERHLAPALAFVPAAPGAAATPGASRLGGAPDLPADQPWPTREAYVHGPALENRLAPRRDYLRGVLTSPAPLYFLAQIDLAAVAGTGVLKDGLPDHGRLLFFWDAKCGCYIDSAESCRVIWDRSPAASLAPKHPPAGLACTAADGWDFPDLFKPKPVDFLGIWSMPDRFLLKELAERTNDQELLDSFEDDDWVEVWDALWEDVMDAGASHLASGREVLPHRFGGWPIPVQWDPRFAAAGSALGTRVLFGRQPTEAEQKETADDMHRWAMLLQLNLNGLSNYFGE